MPVPAALHAPRTSSLSHSPHNETPKDSRGPKPGVSLLTCLWAFQSMIYYVKSLLHTHLCISKFKEEVGRTMQNLPCPFVFEQEYVLLTGKTPSSPLHQLHRNDPYQVPISRPLCFFGRCRKRQEAALPAITHFPQRLPASSGNQFHSCSSTQESNSSQFSFIEERKCSRNKASEQLTVNHILE